MGTAASPVSVTPPRYVGRMIIDCDGCRMRDTSACDDCVVTVLIGGGPMELDGDETSALRNLAEVGLVPHLRLVQEGERPPKRATG